MAQGLAIPATMTWWFPSSRKKKKIKGLSPFFSLRHGLNSLIINIMAKIYQGILGHVTGGIGGFNGYIVRNKNIIRKKPGIYVQKEKGVMTEQRKKYSMLVAWWKVIPTEWKSMFLFLKGNQLSSYNYFVVRNINSFDPQNPYYQLDVEMVLSNAVLDIYHFSVNLEQNLLTFERILPVSYSNDWSALDHIYLLYYVYSSGVFTWFKIGKRSNNIIHVPITYWGGLPDSPVFLWIGESNINGTISYGNYYQFWLNAL
jgi:hypothetical protein